MLKIKKRKWPVIVRRARKIAKGHAASCLSVSPSVRMEQLGYHWTDIRKI